MIGPEAVYLRLLLRVMYVEFYLHSPISLQGQLYFIRCSTFSFFICLHISQCGTLKDFSEAHAYCLAIRQSFSCSCRLVGHISSKFPTQPTHSFLPIHFSIHTHQNLSPSNLWTMFLQNVRLRHLRQTQKPKWTTTDEQTVKMISKLIILL